VYRREDGNGKLKALSQSIGWVVGEWGVGVILFDLAWY
jgi:hypothetical protein